MTQSKTTPIGHFFLGAVLCGVILGLHSQQRLDWLTGPVNRLLYPVRFPFVAANSWLTVQLQTVRNLPHQERLIKDLKRRNSELSLQADRAARLEAENSVLRTALKIPVAAPFKILPAQVITLSRYALIDQGSLAGVKSGQAVVSDGVFLGTIGEVQSRSARVMLLADPATELTARTASGVSGQVRYASNVLKLEQIPQKDPLEVEEPVFTKGNETIPGGLLIGHIKVLDETPAAVYKSASLEPALTIGDFQTVLVLIN